MILVITHKEDYTADFLINKLNQRKIDYYRFNCEDICDKNFEFSSETNFDFIIENIQQIKSIWFRRTKLPNIELEDEGERIFIMGEYDSLLNNLYQLFFDKVWISHPSKVYAAENKLYQFKIAQSVGFTIPDTIVTNQHSLLKSFIIKNNKNVIIKTLSQGRVNTKSGTKAIFTNKLSEDDIEQLDNYTLTPAIVQEYVDKIYELRITVVGDRVFSAKVNSQLDKETQIDWRKKKLPFEKYDLPIDISQRCIELTKALGLSFGAIDLIKKPSGEYIFLEINPNGQWAWLETDSDLQISDAIIDVLTTYDN